MLANFYQQFIQGFSQIATLLTSILGTTNGLATSKSILTSEGSIKGFGSGNMVDKANGVDETSKVGKANTGSSKPKRELS